MIRANFRLKIEELNTDLIEKLKTVFNKEDILEINICDEVEETDFLLSTSANRESLYRSLEQLGKGEIISKSLGDIVE